MNDKEWVLRRERKKTERELGIYHVDCIRTRKTGADGRAPIERVAGTAEEGKYHKYSEIHFC